MRIKRDQPPVERDGCAPPRGREGIGPLVRSALMMWGRSAPPRMAFLLRAGWRVWRANARRARQERLLGAHIPTVLALSPTMRCNYNCRGCYSRGRPDAGELTTAELDALFTEAESFGILAVVVTGGEPLLRDDLPGLIARHRRLPLLFPRRHPRQPGAAAPQPLRLLPLRAPPRSRSPRRETIVVC